MLTFDLKWLLLILTVSLSLLLLITAGGAAHLARRAEQKRQAQSKLASLRLLFEVAPVGVALLAERGLLYANAYARRLLALDEQAHADRTQPLSLPQEGWAQRLSEDADAVCSAETPEGRYRTISLDGGQTVRWWVTAWEEGALVLLLDVTAQQQMEQSTQVLLSDLAHELRTPLATLSAHLHILQLPSVGPEVHEQSLRFLQEETERLVRLVNNTLELGRMGASSETELRPVDLLPCVEEVVRQLHNEAIARSIDVRVEADIALSPVLGQPDRLKQLFLNLLDNAIKYSRPGDSVRITLHSASDLRGVACAVCDTGPGIAAEHLPHLTRRYYRAAPSGMAGSGLGLALVEEILRRHQSALTIESKTAADVGEGEATGLCVRFVLPAAPTRMLP